MRLLHDTQPLHLISSIRSVATSITKSSINCLHSHFLLSTWLLYMTIPTMVSGSETLAKLYHLKGICNLEGQWMLSIKDNTNERHLWLRIGQRVGELRLNDYNPETGIATLAYQNHAFDLKLAESSHTPLRVLGSTTVSNDALNQINIKTEKYRQDVRKLLTTLAPESRTPEALAKLERDLEASVANYKQNLLATHNDTNTSELNNRVTADANPLLVTGVKRQNQINSRIWASDHIKIHGLQTE